MQYKTNLLVSVFIISLMAHPVFSKNIAVMPFENITKDTDKNWIGAGFAETLTTKLCKVKEVNLLEREQLSKILDEIKFQKSGLVDENTAVQTGKMYGVDVMVFGSYQVMGDTLRVSARFVSVETRKVIDTSEATGNISDIFKLQDSIAFDMMNSLKIVLVEKEKTEIKLNPTENLTAYQWNSKGIEASNLNQKDTAILYHKKAISISPEYAEAYYNLGTEYQLKKNYDKAVEMYQKAININPGYAKAYYNIGRAYDQRGSSDILTPTQAMRNAELEYDRKGYSYKAIGYYKKAAKLGDKDAQEDLTGMGIDW